MPSLAPEAFQGLSARLLWLALLHGLWIGAAVASAVALIVQGRAGLSHRTRHAILLGSLAFVAIAPILLAGWQVASPAIGPRVATTSVSTVVIGTGVAPTTRKLEEPLKAPMPTPPTAASWWNAINRNYINDAVNLLRAVRPIGLVAWILGIIGLGVIPAIGASELRRLRRESIPAPGHEQARIRRLSRRLNLRKAPLLLVHPRVSEPCLCGLVRPLIFLPDRWLVASSGEQVEAVLAHELAHARRGDHVINLAQRLLELAFFFHPAVHWLSRSLRHQREYCADALAIRITRNPMALARALESVARLRQRPSAPLPLGAVLAGETPSLLPRIQELIGMTPSNPQARRPLWPFAALPLAALFAITAASAGASQEPQDKPEASSSGETKADSPGVTIKSTPVFPGTHGIEDVILLAPDPDMDMQPEWNKAQMKAFQEGRRGQVATPLEFPKPMSDNQVSQEVRFASIDAKAWKEFLNGRQANTSGGEQATSWLLDQKDLAQLLRTVLASGPERTVVQAPKVTMFEGMQALISTSRHLSVRLTDQLSPPNQEKFQAVTQATVLASGSFTPEGVSFKAKYHNVSLPPYSAFDHFDTSKPTTIVLKKPEPPFVVSKGHLSCEVPDGSSVVIKVEPQAGDKAGVADANTKDIQRLIIITPRAIRLEPEDQKVRATPAK
ncbi:M56 family metallopeptidase [Singulisphaera sp. PoT]|uniref:M56 family metallopeptidase n=1 Tax=Singulisphaera sp. PoT TaxID=3411797 RepID=UPI003BF4BF40